MNTYCTNSIEKPLLRSAWEQQLRQVCIFPKTMSLGIAKWGHVACRRTHWTVPALFCATRKIVLWSWWTADSYRDHSSPHVPGRFHIGKHRCLNPPLFLTSLMLQQLQCCLQWSVMLISGLRPSSLLATPLYPTWFSKYKVWLSCVFYLCKAQYLAELGIDQNKWKGIIWRGLTVTAWKGGHTDNPTS